jgi:hypothetical protein
LKRNFTNVDRGWVRVFGTEKVSYFLAFTLAGLNVMLAGSFRRMLATGSTGFKSEAPPESPHAYIRGGPWTNDRQRLDGC